MSYLFNNEVGFQGSALDGFARLKTSQPYTVFDSQHRYKENGQWDTAVAVGGTTSHNPNESAVLLTVGASAGAYVYRETRRVFAYQPGKALTAINTFAMSSAKNNLTQRVGYFNTQNGIYLEQGGFPFGNNLYFVLRSSVGGSVQETKVSQSQWNGDVLDGSGPSGITLDPSKANISFFDIEWLGVGSVRCGFFFEGRPVVAHTFHNANKNTSTYMTTACLPLRYEILNDPVNNTASSSTMRQICSTVISDGGYEGKSRPHSVGFGLTASADMKTLTNASQYYPLLSIRLKSDRTDAVVVPSQLDILASTKGNYHYKILENAVLSGASWTAHSAGTVEWDKSATSFSGGTEIGSGFFTELSEPELPSPREFVNQLTRSIGGTADIITVVVASQSVNQKVECQIGWQELV
jgi:hypothetical protein